MATDPYRYFRIEARELLDALGRDVLALERDATPDVAQRLLRAAHTLKGAARIVRQVDIAEASHAIEELLEPQRTSTTPVSRATIDRLLALVDAIGGGVDALAPAPAPAPDEVAALATDSVDVTRALRADLGELESLQEALIEIGVELRVARRSLSGLERAKHLAEVLVSQLEGERQGLGRARALAEELRTLTARLDREHVRAVEHVEREADQAREIADRLRLSPVSALFPALERVVRDTAQALGKHATLSTGGGEVRLEGSALALIRDAVIQLLRNAVAHGIDRSGSVRVTVERRGTRIAVVVSDDGRGLDVQAIRAVAAHQSRGAGSAVHDVDSALRALLDGGISTSTSVNEHAGRGIGLTIVREAAAALGGEVRARSAAGKGTSIEIVIPATTSSLPVVLVSSAGGVFAIPLDAVRTARRVEATEITLSGTGDSLWDGGASVPFVPLSRLVPARVTPRGLARMLSVVVVEGASGRVALGVDRLLGTTTVVTRPLPSVAHAMPIVAGAILDAEGTPQILLDVDVVVEACRAAVGAPAVGLPERARPILVIDDSLTTRMLEQSILESAGYEVDLAMSAEEGIERARKRRYGVFLVDVEMPGMDGFTFVEKTRADATLRDVPAILVTSRDAPEDRLRGERAGASAYVAKGEFDQGALLQVIANLLGAR